MTAAGPSCGSCGTELPLNSKFCNECGAPVKQLGRSAEYKQVTVLFADVVHSMEIAAAVGAERLREIMSEQLDRCTAVVRRSGGTLNQFTGDGIMAVFGAPITVIRDIWLLRLRALVARAHGDDGSYRDHWDRYRTMATSLGFGGHMKWAEVMP